MFSLSTQLVFLLFCAAIFPTQQGSPKLQSVLVLDLDGTLYDNDCKIESQIRENYYAYASTLGYTQDQCVRLRRKYGSTVRGISERLGRKEFFVDYYNHVYPQLSMLRLRKYCQESKERTGYQFHRMSAAHAALRHVKAPIVIASNSPVFHVKRMLSRVGLANLNVSAFITPERRGGITKLEASFWDPLFELYPRNKYKCSLIDDNFPNIQLIRSLGVNGLHVSESCTFDDALMSYLGLSLGKSFRFDENTYLTEKNKVDARSFNSTIRTELVELIVEKVRNKILRGRRTGKVDCIRVVDLGAGHVSMLDHIVQLVSQVWQRIEASHTTASGCVLHYIAFESNPDLLQKSLQELRRKGVKFVRVEDVAPSSIPNLPTNGSTVRRFEGWMRGIKIVLHLSQEDFMSSDALAIVDTLKYTPLFADTATPGGSSGSSDSNSGRDGGGGSTLPATVQVVDLIVGSCLADLIPPRALVNQLVELGDDAGAVVYLPITFNGTTSMRRASSSSSSSSSPSSSSSSHSLSYSLPSMLSSGFSGSGSGSASTELPLPEETQSILRHYDSYLERMGHHIHSRDLVKTFEMHGCRVVDDGRSPSDWVISRRRDPYMWQCMLSFILKGTYSELMSDVDIKLWLDDVLAAKEDVEIIANNVDLLVELPNIEKFIHYPSAASESSGGAAAVGAAAANSLTPFAPAAYSELSSLFCAMSVEELRAAPGYLTGRASSRSKQLASSPGGGSTGSSSSSGEGNWEECLLAAKGLSYSSTPPSRQAVVFTAPQEIEVQEERMPLLGPKDVLIRTACSLVSTGTELKVFRGEMEESQPTDLTIPGMKASPMRYPLRYGYSLVGTVVKVGKAVPERETWIGRRVFSFSPHATYAVAAASAVMSIPDDVSFEDAAFMPSVETALSLAMSAQPNIGESTAVIGSGLIGLLTAAVLKWISPASDVTAIDLNPARLSGAKEFVAQQQQQQPQQQQASGGSRARSAFTAATPLKVRTPSSKRSDEVAEGGGEGSAGEAAVLGYDVSIEVSGNMAGLQTAVDCTRDGGKVVVGSWYKAGKGHGHGQGQGASASSGTGGDLRLGTRFHRSGIQLVASQVSKIPPQLSGRWDKERRFQLTWDLVAALKPSRMLLLPPPSDSSPTSSSSSSSSSSSFSHQSSWRGWQRDPTVDMTDAAALKAAFKQLGTGQLLTVMLKPPHEM